MTNINYLDKDDILTAHQMGFSQFGGTMYGFDDSCVEKRVVEPQTAYWGTEQYPGLFKKAAVYMEATEKLRTSKFDTKKLPL